MLLESQERPNQSEGILRSRDQMLAVLENLEPLSKEDADWMRQVILEAREQSILDQQTEIRCECIKAFCAELQPFFNDEEA